MHLFFPCTLVFGVAFVVAQDDIYNPTRQYPTDNGIPVLNGPNLEGYDTFVYNNRRYSQQLTFNGRPRYPYVNNRNNYGLPPYRPGYPGFSPFDPNNPLNRDKNIYYNNPGESPQVFLPGVLGGWRADLQGKEREESKQELPADRDIFVETVSGKVQGFKVHLYDDPNPEIGRPDPMAVEKRKGMCNVFLGIPYAQPPVLEGRFKPPRPHKGWQLIQAVDYGPACPQPLKYIGATKGVLSVNEDCLYLNVYTPSIEGAAQKFPVLFYIHGGDFTHGASNLFLGHYLATFYKVVVVTINYRLGALGFLSTADENSPGNYGILDQAMALRWVHDNIDAFNGDRDSITLMGPDAGGASAGLLMLMPQTRNLVKGIISQGGSPLADWAFIYDKYQVQNTSRVYGLVMGCSIESSWKLVNCLKTSRSASEIGNPELNPTLGILPWAPTIFHNISIPWYDGWQESNWLFLKEKPEEIIRRGEFNRKIRYLSGVTTQEAAFFVKGNMSLAPYFQIDQKFFDLKLKEHVKRYNYTLNPWGVFNAIKHMYTYWPDVNSSYHIRDQYIKMLSDMMYVAPSDKMVKMLLEKKVVDVYQYVLNTTVEAFNYEEWYKYPHNIEQNFMMGTPFFDEEFLPKKNRIGRNAWTNNDRNMSHFFMKAISDFAYYGNPSYQQILGLHFERMTVGELKYLNVNTTFNSTIMMNYRQTECGFWSYYLSTVIGYLVATYPPTTEIWWEPRQPLQIAFWGMSGLCMLLIVLVVVCCMLWRSAKRSRDGFDNDLFIIPDQPELICGLDAQRSPMYEYRDLPYASSKTSKVLDNEKSSSLGSLLSDSALSTREKLSPVSHVTNRSTKSRTHVVQGVPQTQV